MGKTQYLTATSLANLKKEYENVKNIKIPEIAVRIDEAKQQGDLSENAEYHQAKEDMAWAHGRLLELNHLFEHAKIIDEKSGGGVIDIGNTVKVRVNGKEKEYTIVGPQEANPPKGLISNESPLGSAFLGHSGGDRVEVITPAGKQEYEIVCVN